MKDPYKQAWAFCRYHFNMSGEEFDSLTLEEVEYLKDQVFAEWERQDARTAQICALMANLNTKNGKYKPQDFMPKYKGSEKPAMTEEQLLKVVKTVHFMHTGEKF